MVAPAALEPRAPEPRAPEPRETERQALLEPPAWAGPTRGADAPLRTRRARPGLIAAPGAASTGSAARRCAHQTRSRVPRARSAAAGRVRTGRALRST